jgi:hypothetical protein
VFARYGETEYNSETAVNVLLDIILDKSGKTYKSALLCSLSTNPVASYLVLAR